jgi:hypothetical protein
MIDMNDKSVFCQFNIEINLNYNLNHNVRGSKLVFSLIRKTNHFRSCNNPLGSEYGYSSYYYFR